MFKANRLLAVAALLSAFTLTGCLGGSTEPSRYYTVSAESISVAGATSDTRVHVKKFTIDPAYQRTNIVYRESPYDFMFYDLDLWATRPEQMLTQVAGEYLIKSNMFKSVDLKPMGKPDFELLGARKKHTSLCNSRSARSMKMHRCGKSVTTSARA